MAPPSVLVVADPERIAELVAALEELAGIDVLVGSGGDDTLDLFAARKPPVVVATATLATGDSGALVEALRGLAPRAEVAIVLVGDDEGPIRTALDALEIGPERFVMRPLQAKALRFAVTSALDGVALARPSLAAMRAPTAEAEAAPLDAVDDGPTTSQRAALRARWEALADSFADVGDSEVHALPPLPDPADEPAPLPPLVIINPRRRESTSDMAPPQAWRPGTTDQLAPVREPTLILNEHAPLPAAARTRTGDDNVIVAARGDNEDEWSKPMALAEIDEAADAARDGEETREAVPPAGRDELGLPLDDFDDDLILGDDLGDDLHPHELDDAAPMRDLPPIDDAPRAHRTPPPTRVVPPAPPALPPPDDAAPPAGRDFARQLRAKMSMMAQRLFQGADSSPSPASDHKPRHDHHTEIDLASLGDELPLGGGVTEIEARAIPRSHELRDVVTSPGGWDTHVRERGLPDAGELVRGVSDAAMLLAKMFAQSTTGRVAFRRDAVETIVYFDTGRPVFASSNEPRDRMGELLVREGKITASQYERCQAIVAESGRRMGEILVDFGYLKRRELLPAVRRHVEDIIYSLFGWERGHYRITVEQVPSAERIRLSRHAAAIVLEGVRRKLDRTSLERLLGPPSTIIEVPDRERLATVVNLGDLSAEERAALAAFDGQADLANVARVAGVDVADVLPLAWGLCALGLATWRRTDTEVPDESTALVGETDLVIDRDRVRARWQLVTEADYFALLGVRRDATAFEIRRAYQSARRDFAADCFPQDLRRELAQELVDIANVLDEAFRVLRDDRLRVTYLSNLVG